MRKAIRKEYINGEGVCAVAQVFLFRLNPRLPGIGQTELLEPNYFVSQRAAMLPVQNPGTHCTEVSLSPENLFEP